MFVVVLLVVRLKLADVSGVLTVELVLRDTEYVVRWRSVCDVVAAGEVTECVLLWCDCVAVAGSGCVVDVVVAFVGENETEGVDVTAGEGVPTLN